MQAAIGAWIGVGLSWALLGSAEWAIIFAVGTTFGAVMGAADARATSQDKGRGEATPTTRNDNYNEGTV